MAFNALDGVMHGHLPLLATSLKAAAVVLAVNKWRTIYQRELVPASIETWLGFLKFASIHHILAIALPRLGAFGNPLSKLHSSPTARCPRRYCQLTGYRKVV
jgi:predicted GTPase